jgi:hypothetical protein
MAYEKKLNYFLVIQYFFKVTLFPKVLPPQVWEMTGKINLQKELRKKIC